MKCFGHTRKTVFFSKPDIVTSDTISFWRPEWTNRVVEYIGKFWEDGYQAESSSRRILLTVSGLHCHHTGTTVLLTVRQGDERFSNVADVANQMARRYVCRSINELCQSQHLLGMQAPLNKI